MEKSLKNLNLEMQLRIKLRVLGLQIFFKRGSKGDNGVFLANV